MVKRLILSLFLVALTAMPMSAQISKYKALYLFQFAKLTGWPAEDHGKALTVTVIGDQALAKDLKSIAGSKTIGDRAVEVVEASSVTGLSRSDIIYLGESKSSHISQLLQAQKGNKVLIVSGTQGQCSSGAGISFRPNGGKLEFDISETNIGNYGLKVSPNLVKLGHSVY